MDSLANIDVVPMQECTTIDMIATTGDSNWDGACLRETWARYSRPREVVEA
jgi:hypothetical protein